MPVFSSSDGSTGASSADFGKIAIVVVASGLALLLGKGKLGDFFRDLANKHKVNASKIDTLVEGLLTGKLPSTLVDYIGDVVAEVAMMLDIAKLDSKYVRKRVVATVIDWFREITSHEASRITTLPEKELRAAEARKRSIQLITQKSSVVDDSISKLQLKIASSGLNPYTAATVSTGSKGEGDANDV
jgi:type III secretion system FlhB-like substrate exporter